MNKSMLLAVTLTGVTTSAGAAYAGVSVMQSEPVAATVPTTPVTDSSVAGPVARTVSYQVGTAGTVTITLSDGALQVAGASASTGWSVMNSIGGGSHAEVQFGDGVQVVTFLADLVGSDIIVSLTNQLAGDVTTTAPGVWDITIIGDSATPVPQPAPTPGVTVPSGSTPTTSHTSSPSSEYEDDDEDDDEEDDEYEDDEYEDEEDDEEEYEDD